MSIAEKEGNTSLNKERSSRPGFLSPGLIIYVFVLTFIVLSFHLHPIIGNSMNPTFTDGQHVFAVGSFLRGPSKNRIVIADTGGAEGRLIIKRVAAGPGDTLSFMDDGTVLVNGAPYGFGIGNINEPLMYHGMALDASGSYSITLGNDEYYLLGDNFEDSLDSRYYGPFNRRAIKETVLFGF